MKKGFLFVLLFLLASKQFAQIQKGTYVPSFSLMGGYSTTPTKDSTLSSTKNYNWNTGITLSIGKFIKDNLMLSGSMGYTYSYSYNEHLDNSDFHRNFGNENYNNGSSFGLSLLKYKFIGENFAVRVGPGLNLSYSDGISRNYHYDSRLNYILNTSYHSSAGVSCNFQAGVLYFVSKNFGLTGGIGILNVSYQYSPYQKIKHPGIETHTLSFSATPSFNFFNVGLSYYIRPKSDKQ